MLLVVGLLVVRPVTCPGAVSPARVVALTIADALPTPALFAAETTKS
jgi:hypothetical protein